MDWKTKIKDFVTMYNPFAVRRRKRMRKALVNKTPSLLVPNCLGGILFHDLGLQFRSPTVNLMMYQPEFVRLVCALDTYLHKDMAFFKHPSYNFPCATLGDVTIHFTHYQSEEEAAQKWAERCSRIDHDNIFIIAVERDNLTENQIRMLKNIRAKGVVVFSAHDYSDIPYACYVPQLSKNGAVEDLLGRSYLDDHRKYEEVFDFVKWFNEADGGNFDISAFRK